MSFFVAPAPDVALLVLAGSLYGCLIILLFSFWVFHD